MFGNMDVPEQNLILTKAKAATRQVEAAIQALQSGDFDVAITLAGAAEGMMAQEGPGPLFSHIINHPRSLGQWPRKALISLLNEERDWLKHASGPAELGISPFVAGAMIARASSKLESWTPLMEAFRTWFVANLDRLCEEADRAEELKISDNALKG